MIDIHTHILPFVDDGARDIDEAIILIKEEINCGVDSIILTPHSVYRDYIRKEDILRNYSLLKNKVQSLSLDVNLYLGQEILYDDNTINNLKEGKYISLNNSKYVLIEFNPDSSFNYISDALYEVTILGYKPILAHFEVYNLTFINLLELKKQGILIQINASSYLKSNGFRRKLFNKLFKEHIIDYVASDCHRYDYRKPNLNEVKKLFCKYDYLNINRFL